MAGANASKGRDDISTSLNTTRSAASINQQFKYAYRFPSFPLAYECISPPASASPEASGASVSDMKRLPLFDAKWWIVERWKLILGIS